MKPVALIVSLLALAAVVVVTIVASQAGDEDADPGAASPASLEIDYERELADARGPLADLYSKGDVLLGGGPEAFDAELTALEGKPVVVNEWASWCGPCRSEFPFFQEASAKLGDKVGFLGVNADEISRQAGANFLEEYPVPYPSVYDQDFEIHSEEWGLRPGLPATAFYSASGELVHVRQGEYTSLEQLEADVERYTG
ncbi:MAG: TlpA family protein disulfide reductase [Solirubrobacterales bacterium]|nr:TlpA family protein disulfide reductase [Solirubrobacterales bacterium]